MYGGYRLLVFFSNTHPSKSIQTTSKVKMWKFTHINRVDNLPKSSMTLSVYVLSPSSADWLSFSLCINCRQFDTPTNSNFRKRIARAKWKGRELWPPVGKLLRSRRRRKYAEVGNAVTCSPIAAGLSKCSQSDVRSFCVNSLRDGHVETFHDVTNKGRWLSSCRDRYPCGSFRYGGSAWGGAGFFNVVVLSRAKNVFFFIFFTSHTHNGRSRRSAETPVTCSPCSRLGNPQTEWWISSPMTVTILPWVENQIPKGNWSETFQLQQPTKKTKLSVYPI